MDDSNLCQHVPPLLGYDPDTTPTGSFVPEDIGITASVLASFQAGTTCQEVIVGLRLPTPTPSQAIALVVFDSFDLEALPDMPASYAVTVSDSVVFPTKDPYTLEYHFKVETYHEAYLFPLVGTVLDPKFQVATMPECDPERTMRYRPNIGWSHLSDEVVDGLPGTATHASLYYGLAECSPD